MKLYNTLSRQLEEFAPDDASRVKLFVCGPTVYDLSHLGHAKTYTQMDVLVRFLRQQGFGVDYLQNITDIDDKIIIRAQKKGISWEKLRTEYEAAYYQDMETLNNMAVTTYARATDHIGDIIRQVQTLVAKGHAYTISDGVYFEVATFKDYGKLSKRLEVKENDALTRIDQSAQKRGWNDFCLWKFSKPGDPVWEAPFGNGRPGWHIEDTAITEHFFGPQYDVHGGAVDLIFPHHEAEIAQMESASGKVPFVKYWVHAGFLNTKQAKMSKSLGNFYTIRDVLDKGYQPMAIRLLMLQAHYRSELNFSWEVLDAAQSRLKSLQAMADLRFQPVGASKINKQDLESSKSEIVKHLAEDLKTPDALAVLSNLERLLENEGVSKEIQKDFNRFVQLLDEIFGLRLSTSKDITASQKELLKKRLSARAKQNWDQSDQIRRELVKQNLAVRDTAQGQIWQRL